MRSPSILIVLLVAFSGAAFAYDPSYVSDRQVNLARLVPPPPQPDSGRQRDDLQAVLQAQDRRTPAQAEQAVKDNDLSLSQIEGTVLGEKFTASRLTKFAAFYARVVADAGAILNAAKQVWNRPRPFTVSAEVNAIGERPSNASYPSGHATRGWLAAVMLANMVPEKSAALYARGREYGENRVVAGVHFPTDVEAGRLSATAIASGLMQNAQFWHDFDEARAELREALGLAQDSLSRQ